ncbi:MAG: PDZ domain-containing protein [Candidatus Omnitrophica bacterium]|nr:PDZ domain-containing protein [Candidatus Omnitrophota bacterium]
MGIIKKRLAGIWLVIFVAVSPISYVYAGTYSDLAPGRSTRQDADRMLGNPVREVVKGARYDYDPQDHDARRISVSFYLQTGIIKSIDIYPLEQYKKQQLQDWFHLSAPDVKMVDDDGNYHEMYGGVGIVLYFDGPDDSFAVDTIRYFDQVIKAQKGDEQGLSSLQVSKENRRPYLGISAGGSDEGIIVKNVVSNSPAEQAGLQVGDIILKMGEYSYRGKADPYEFIDRIAEMPVTKPILFIIVRNKKQQRVTVTLGTIQENDWQELNEGVQWPVDDKKIKQKETSRIKQQQQNEELSGKFGMMMNTIFQEMKDFNAD